MAILDLLEGGRPGYYCGKHYSKYVGEVEALMCADDLAAAESLLLELVSATEAAALTIEKGYPAPWYYEKLAIIYRKRKDYAAEIRIIERYTSHEYIGEVGARKLAQRLQKATELEEESRGQHG